MNYAWYCAAVAGGVLIAEGIPHPSDLSEEARRVAFTFAGVGIAVLVTFLAGLLSKHAGQAARPQTAGRKQGDRQPVTDWPSRAGGMRRDGA